MTESAVKRRHVLLTTSRRPTQHMRTFCRDLSHTFPTVIRINRGKLSLEGILEKTLELDAEKVMIIERWNEGAAQILLFEVKQETLKPVQSPLYVRNVRFRREFAKNASKVRRIRSVAIVASQDESSEIRQLENLLSNFLGIPILSVKEVANSDCDCVMQILKDSPSTILITFRLIPEYVEIGPQIRLLQLANAD